MPPKQRTMPNARERLRAHIACQTCRARKVRCNVAEHGAPCTNCRLDRIDCAVVQRARTRRRHGSAAALIADGGEARPKLPPDVSQALLSPPLSREGVGVSDGEDVTRQYANNVTDGRVYPPPPDGMHNDYGFPIPVLPRPDTSNHLPVTSSPTTDFKIRHQPCGPSSLPVFIRPLDPEPDALDLDFLIAKGVFDVPDVSVRREICHAYLEAVHSFLPFLDRNKLPDASDDQLEAEIGAGERPQISLLLFQAIMFAGSLFVDFSALKALGYETRKAARDAFYKRTRTLYDLDVEPDRMAILQAVLLMSLWYEDPNDQKDVWYWSGVGASLVHVLELSERDRSPGPDARAFKRLWWSCFVRDASVSLAMRRPMRLTRYKDAPSMLTLEDFNLSNEPGEAAVDERDLAMLCIQRAKLCTCILSLLMVDDASTLETYELKCRSCEVNLDEWFRALPEKFTNEALWRVPMDEEDDYGSSVATSRILLLMLYYVAENALHLPQIIPGLKASKEQMAQLKNHSTKVINAARKTTQLAEHALNYGLVRNLPSTAFTAVLPTVSVHILNIKSSQPSIRESSLNGLKICMQLLVAMQERYSAAHYYMREFELAFSKIGIQVNVPPGHPENGAPALLFSKKPKTHRASLSSRPGKPPGLILQQQQPPTSSPSLADLHLVTAPPPQPNMVKRNSCSDSFLPCGSRGSPMYRLADGGFSNNELQTGTDASQSPNSWFSFGMAQMEGPEMYPDLDLSWMANTAGQSSFLVFDAEEPVGAMM